MNEIQEYIQDALVGAYHVLSANSTTEKIEDFADIDEGWHFGEGVPLDATAIRDAIRVHEKLIEFGFYETDAFPGLAGEVRVTAYWEDNYFEFTREPNGRWTFIQEVDDVEKEEAERQNLNLAQVKALIEDIATNIWTTSVTCPYFTGTKRGDGTLVWRFDPQKTEESQWLNKIVSPPSEPSAHISGAIIQSLANPQFFGGLAVPFSTDIQLSNLHRYPGTNATEKSWVLWSENPSASLKPIASNRMILKSATETMPDLSAQRITPLQLKESASAIRFDWAFPPGWVCSR